MRKRRSTTSRKRAVKRPVRKSSNPGLLFDVLGVGLIVLCPIIYLALIAPNSSGFVGKFICAAAYSSVGVGAWVIPILFALLGGMLVIGPLKLFPKSIGIGSTILFNVIISWASLNVLIKGLETSFSKGLAGNVGGGFIGDVFAYLLRGAFGDTISYFSLIALAIIAIVIIVDVPLVHLIEQIRCTWLDWREASLERAEAGSVRLPNRRVKEPKEERETKPGKPGILESAKSIFVKEKDEIVPDEPAKVIPKIHMPSNIKTEKLAKSSSKAEDLSIPLEEGEFRLPPSSLLDEPQPPPLRVESELRGNIEIIERTLEEFKVSANVVEIACGPTVARYEIQLAPGIKVNKIVGLADNLAMQLAAIDVRVEAPIPGKAAIGVEVPNKNRATVGLREIIESSVFKNAPGKLTFALGKDVAGNPMVTDLTKMPHLLVGGSTNSGKSVGLSTFIASLLFRATPDELKLVLIDPKRVELSLFDGIPHLAYPVVKDAKVAASIFRSIVSEMEKRYDIFARVGARNLESYNSKMPEKERMPFMVVVVDELCDLMMQCAAEVEGSITRIAQLARATGIHLVIATQRPSVDVITGVIKANISSRIAFAVSSHHDSRTILDMKGAERLIGRGDMLFLPMESGKPMRVQGCYLSDKEIENLCKFLKDQRAPVYTLEPTSTGGGPGMSGEDDETFADEYYEPSVRFVVSTGYCSTSMLQRKFKIGYTRAARIVDAMELAGIVGALDGAKPRQVLISKTNIESVLGGQVGMKIVDEEEDSEDDEDEIYEDDSSDDKEE